MKPRTESKAFRPRGLQEAISTIYFFLKSATSRPSICDSGTLILLTLIHFKTKKGCSTV